MLELGQEFLEKTNLHNMTLNQFYNDIIIFSLVSITFIFCYYISKIIINRICIKIKNSNRIIAISLKHLIKHLYISLTLIWLIVIDDFVVKNASQGLWQKAEKFFFLLLTVKVAVILISLSYKIKNSIIIHNNKLDKTIINISLKIVQIVIAIIAFLVSLHIIGVNINAILAFSGAGGLMVGFAAKDLLSNIFGGFIIYFNRPFKIGDWIRSPDQEIEGTVQNIGWRQTQILTFDQRPLYIPNSVFSNISVENPSRMTHRRIYESIGIRYQDINKMDSITKEVTQMLIDHDEIDHEEIMMINFNKFAASSLEFFVYTFTKTTDWQKFHHVKHDILLLIAKIIENNGAEIAFPTITSRMNLEGESLKILSNLKK